MALSDFSNIDNKKIIISYQFLRLFLTFNVLNNVVPFYDDKSYNCTSLHN